MISIENNEIKNLRKISTLGIIRYVDLSDCRLNGKLLSPANQLFSCFDITKYCEYYVTNQSS